MPEFRANTLNDVVRMAVGRELSQKDHTNKRRYEQKRIPEVYAPPLVWGPWVEVFAQFGVVGQGRDEHVTRLSISFRPAARSVAAIGFQIRGGDRMIDTTGPGSETITISGNVATAIEVRAKSFGLGQSIDVDIRQT